MSEIRHGGLIARRLNGVWRGALIEGPSGIGKSDLALRALDAGFRLVADDRVLTFPSSGKLYGKPHETLAGLMEIRGLGVVRQTALPLCEIALVIRCVETPEAVERLPDPRFTVITGVSVPVFDLWPREPAAPLKIGAMMQSLGVAP
ncbi:HPr kinase/phosphorylase [Caulobacter sp. RHG1]|nr:HPr kinase/phosphorylase [Caulobacter sp. RHG1]